MKQQVEEQAKKLIDQAKDLIYGSDLTPKEKVELLTTFKIGKIDVYKPYKFFAEFEDALAKRHQEVEPDRTHFCFDDIIYEYLNEEDIEKYSTVFFKDILDYIQEQDSEDIILITTRGRKLEYSMPKQEVIDYICNKLLSDNVIGFKNDW